MPSADGPKFVLGLVEEQASSLTLAELGLGGEREAEVQPNERVACKVVDF